MVSITERLGKSREFGVGRMPTDTYPQDFLFGSCASTETQSAKSMAQSVTTVFFFSCFSLLFPRHTRHSPNGFFWKITHSSLCFSPYAFPFLDWAEFVVSAVAGSIQFTFAARCCSVPVMVKSCAWE
jgi:hypothetical protein